MKIHIASINLSHTGTSLSYHSTKREAEKELAKAKRDFKTPAAITKDIFHFGSVRSYDCTLTKQGVIDFLNKHTPEHDNG